MNGWDEAVVRLRARTGVAAALAGATVLQALRPAWEGVVVARTAGADLLFTRPGEGFPFPLDVRVSLAGRANEVRLVAPDGVLDRTTASPAEVDAVVAGYLGRLVEPA